jgi:hypothetical protein
MISSAAAFSFVKKDAIVMPVLAYLVIQDYANKAAQRTFKAHSHSCSRLEEAYYCSHYWIQKLT